MSEVTKLSKKVDSISQQLSEMGQRKPSSADVKKWLIEVVEEMTPSAEKLLKKIDETDPISGVPRFGPKNVEKIRVIHEKLSLLKINLEEFIGNCSAAEDIDGVSESAVKADDIPDAIYTNNTVFDTRLGFQESSRLQTMEKTTMQRQDELTALATALDPLGAAKTGLKSSIQDITTRKSGAIAENVLALISQYREHNTPNLGTCIQILSSIISNIISHPDDIKLRQIRLQHPTIYSKLVQPSGGLRLLCACGFNIICDRPDEQDSEKTPVKDEIVLGVHVAAGPLPEDPVVRSVLENAWKLSQTATAFLKEPETEDTNQWIAWFDGLTAVRDILAKQPK